jgi:hypothetical protein
VAGAGRAEAGVRRSVCRAGAGRVRIPRAYPETAACDTLRGGGRNKSAGGGVEV